MPMCTFTCTCICIEPTKNALHNYMYKAYNIVNYMHVCVHMYFNYLFDVVQTLLTAFETDDDRIWYHLLGKRHHFIAVGGGEQDLLTRV